LPGQSLLGGGVGGNVAVLVVLPVGTDDVEDSVLPVLDESGVLVDVDAKGSVVVLDPLPSAHPVAAIAEIAQKISRTNLIKTAFLGIRDDCVIQNICMR
jgi:hypothetical protein